MTHRRVNEPGASPKQPGPVGGAGSRSLRELADEYIGGLAARSQLSGESPRVELNRIASLLRLCGDLPAASLDRKVLLDWQASIGPLKATTRRTYIGAVRRFCQWLLLEEHLAVDPTPALVRVREPRRAPRALQKDAVGRVFAAAQEVPAIRGVRQPAWQAIAALMVGCGLRCVEVSRLNLPDWDPVERGVPEVRRAH